MVPRRARTARRSAACCSGPIRASRSRSTSPLTSPEARGLGVGVALTEHALWWARKQGHDRIKADWRIANLLASRFWPKRGFKPTAYRMVRYLHPEAR